MTRLLQIEVLAEGIEVVASHLQLHLGDNRWHNVTWCAMTCMTQRDMTWPKFTLRVMTSYAMTRHDMTWHGVTWRNLNWRDAKCVARHIMIMCSRTLLMNGIGWMSLSREVVKSWRLIVERTSYACFWHWNTRRGKPNKFPKRPWHTSKQTWW